MNESAADLGANAAGGASTGETGELPADLAIDSTGALLAEITMLINEVNLVGDHVDQGLPIDLSGFQDRISAICAAIYASDRTVAEIAAGPMTNLVDALDRLGKKIDSALDAPPPHHRAVSAYSRVEGSDL